MAQAGENPALCRSGVRIRVRESDGHLVHLTLEQGIGCMFHLASRSVSHPFSIALGIWIAFSSLAGFAEENSRRQFLRMSCGSALAVIPGMEAAANLSAESGFADSWEAFPIPTERSPDLFGLLNSVQGAVDLVAHLSSGQVPEAKLYDSISTLFWAAIQNAIWNTDDKTKTKVETILAVQMSPRDGQTEYVLFKLSVEVIANGWVQLQDLARPERPATTERGTSRIRQISPTIPFRVTREIPSVPVIRL